MSNTTVEKKSGIEVSRSTLGLVFIIIGLVGLVGGIVWRVLQMKVVPKPTNDLPVFIAIIGGIIALYGVTSFLKVKKLGKTFHLGGKEVSGFVLGNAIMLALIVMVIVICFIEPKFIQIKVLLDILRQASTRIIIALGVSFIILTGGTDLSAGRMVGFAAVIAASMMQTADYARRFWPDLPQVSVILPIIIAIIITTALGYLNGLFVAKLSIPPFIGTLGMQVIVWGICSIYFAKDPNNSQPIGGIRKDFSDIGTKLIGNYLPVLIIFAFVAVAIVWFLQNKTVFGKNVYAVGGNVEAAKVSGINVGVTLIACYTIAGFCYGLAGVLEAARTAGATNNYGFGYELDAIASCVVGGLSVNGGVGKVSGVVTGVLIFTVISYGLSFIGLNPYWQQIAKGVIIIAAVAIDTRKYLQRT